MNREEFLRKLAETRVVYGNGESLAIAWIMGLCYWCEKLELDCTCDPEKIREYKQKFLLENLPRELEKLNIRG